MEAKIILVVDDDAGVLRLLTQLLTRAGYHVISASDGPEALAGFARKRPPVSLVVCDVVMPGMSGPQLMDAIDEFQPGIPVLFITGFAHAEALRDRIIARGIPFLYKPFKPSELLAKVEEILRDSRAAASSAS